MILQACESLATKSGSVDPSTIENYWIGAESPLGTEYFSKGIHAVLGYCDTTFTNEDGINFLSYCHSGTKVCDAWKLACLELYNTPYAVVVRESNLNDYMSPLSSGSQIITRDSTKLANETTFIFYYYNGNQMIYEPSGKDDSNNENNNYYEIKKKIDKIVIFKDIEDVNAYKISSEKTNRLIEMEQSTKNKFAFTKTTDYHYTVSRNSDKLSSDIHTIDINSEKMKSIVKESGLILPDDFVLSSRGIMKVWKR